MWLTPWLKNKSAFCSELDSRVGAAEIYLAADSLPCTAFSNPSLQILILES